ncbi:MAG: FAD-binding protein, partial [Candidatus Diapherotrites archaeon]
MEQFDVIIIGGSVAGLRSAEQLAKRGLSVLCLERKQEVGVPKHCGEGLGLGHFKRLGLKPDKRWCAAAMKGAILYTP